MLFTLSIGNNISGQNPKEKIQLGLYTEVHTFGSDAQFTLGTGQSFGAWLAMPLKKGKSLGLKFAYRQLMGYQQEEIHLAESIFPNQVHRILQVKQLRGLSYWDIDLSWNATLFNHQRWTWGGGMKLAVLDRARGQSNTTIMTAAVEGFSFAPSLTRLESQQLETKEFAALDLGIFAQLSYELIKNLSCTMTYYQGTNSLLGNAKFPGQDSHYLSQFSIGLKARIR